MSDERRGFATRAIHAPGAPAGAGRPLAEPIVAATTYAFEDTGRMARVLAGDDDGYAYSRLRNPTVAALGRACAELEGADDGQAFSSGLAALAAALVGALEPGDTLLAGVQLYGSTHTLIERHLRPRGVRVEYLDVTDLALWERAAAARLVETIANPGFPVADLAGHAERKDGGFLVVDNTFASPALCRPLEHGADLVCESATKYLNGHHDATAGLVCGPERLVGRARAQLAETGAALDPFSAFLVLRGLRTLPLRIERHCANALVLARFLESRPGVERVHYAGLESCPQHAVARRQLAGFGGMLAVEIGGGRKGAERVMDGLSLAARATSLGGVETVVHHPASTSHRDLDPEQLRRAGISEGLVRVSVGCEDADDIVDDFARALQRI